MTCSLFSLFGHTDEVRIMTAAVLTRHSVSLACPNLHFLLPSILITSLFPPMGQI